MKINTDQGSFDTDELKLVDRWSEEFLIITLESGIRQFTGQSARQAWAQINEQAEDVDQTTPITIRKTQ